MTVGSPIVIGTVGGPFGIHGWVHVRSFTEPAENILVYQPWQLRRKAGGWTPVAACARAHHRGFIARVEGVDDRNAAAQVCGAEIGVDETVLPTADDGEYYWRELTGLRVATLDNDDLGTVKQVFATPAHDVLVVEDDERERLLPFVRQVVVKVDRQSGRIVVDWRRDWH